MKFQSTKVLDGYSACFRQWRAEGTHCKFLHGYAVSVKLVFEGELDDRNWVWDFGGFKRATSGIDGLNPKQWFAWLLDHTTIVAEDDPFLDKFKQLDSEGVIQLRVVPQVGCERFAEFIYNKVENFLAGETGGRVSLVSVEVREHERNSAIYTR